MIKIMTWFLPFPVLSEKKKDKITEQVLCVLFHPQPLFRWMSPRSVKGNCRSWSQTQNAVPLNHVFQRCCPHGTCNCSCCSCWKLTQKRGAATSRHWKLTHKGTGRATSSNLALWAHNVPLFAPLVAERLTKLWTKLATIPVPICMYDMGVSENRGIPKSSILIGFTTNYKPSILGYHHFRKHPDKSRTQTR